MRLRIKSHAFVEAEREISSGPMKSARRFSSSPTLFALTQPERVQARSNPAREMVLASCIAASSGDAAVRAGNYALVRSAARASSHSVREPCPEKCAQIEQGMSNGLDRCWRVV